MKAKLVTTCLLATVFCATAPIIVSAQSTDIRCENSNTLLETKNDCDPNRIKKLDVDPTTTGSVDSINGVSNNKSSDDSGTSADEGGSTAGDDDHDNGHGNDPDHDDSSNPGQGGGNHGADK